MFYEQLVKTAGNVHKIITQTPEGISNVTEWCKKPGCWESVKSMSCELENTFVAGLLDPEATKAIKKDAKKVQKIDNKIKAQVTVYEEIGAEKWKKILEWGSSKNLLSAKDKDFLKVAANIPHQFPSDKQCVLILQIFERLKEEGLVI